MEEKKRIRLGIDIGSTTAKVMAIHESDEILYAKYVRHNARVKEALLACLTELEQLVDNPVVSVRMTGSVGMGVAEKYAIPFVQEVVAATRAIRQAYPGVQSLIDIGGEDAKVVFFRNGEAKDLRMNGNCAGGTHCLALRSILQDGYPEPGGQEREPGGYCGLHFSCSGRADGGYLGSRM